MKPKGYGRRGLQQELRGRPEGAQGCTDSGRYLHPPGSRQRDSKHAGPTQAPDGARPGSNLGYLAQPLQHRRFRCQQQSDISCCRSCAGVYAMPLPPWVQPPPPRDFRDPGAGSDDEPGCKYCFEATCLLVRVPTAEQEFEAPGRRLSLRLPTSTISRPCARRAGWAGKQPKFQGAFSPAGPYRQLSA